MSKKRTYFQCNFRNSSFGTRSTNQVDRDPPACSMGRVQMLSKNTIDYVRSGQVIGSQSRAIEELVRNSILHGKATVVDVIIGKTKTSSSSRKQGAFVPSLQVKDNGIGIDSDSVEKFIGTHYCTFHDGQQLPGKGGFGKSSSNSNCKGESLKSLASLCLEMQIETCFAVQKPQSEKKPVSSSPYFSRSSSHKKVHQHSHHHAPTKRRRRQEHHQNSDSSFFSSPPTTRGKDDGLLVSSDQSSCSSYYLTHCNKVVKNGTMASFKSSRSSFEDHNYTRKHHSPPAEQQTRQQSQFCSPARPTKSDSATSSNSSVRRQEQQSLPPSSKNVEPSTGTHIKIHGLFHNHEVRRKHDIMTSDLHSSKGPGIIKARHCIQILALAFPTVTIRLYFDEENIVSWNYRVSSLLGDENDHDSRKRNVRSSSSSTTSTRQGSSDAWWTKSFMRGLRQRIIQLCGGGTTGSNEVIDIVSKFTCSTMQIREEEVQEVHDGDLTISIGACNSLIPTSTSTTACDALVLQQDDGTTTNVKNAVTGGHHHHQQQPIILSARSMAKSGIVLPLGEKNQEWNLCGILYLTKEDERGRHRNNELIFINGRLAEYHAALADRIQDICSSHDVFGNCGKVASFLLHVFCPDDEIDLIVDDSQSQSSTRYKQKLEMIVIDSIQRSLKSKVSSRSSTKSKNNNCLKRKESCCSWGKKEACQLKMNTESRERVLSTTKRIGNTSSRVISTQILTTTSSSTTAKSSTRRTLLDRQLTMDIEHCCQQHQVPLSSTVTSTTPCTAKSTVTSTLACATSPFTDAFFKETTVEIPSIPSTSCTSTATINRAGRDITSRFTSTTTNRMAYNANTWDNTHELSTGTNWTRTRLKALESEIADLAVRKRTDEKNSRATRITKEMLAKAQFVAQLNAKFIVILTDGGLLCILDQHAADERIGLERLEHALEEIVSTSNTSSAQTRNSVDAFLSKKGLMKSADILKDIPVSSQIISMSASNFTTLLRHKNSVLKWRFMFDITNEACREIRLTRVPCICGKSASTKDFLQFIQVLGQQHSLGTTTLMKPPFAKRILASHACRYAIMFGDLLTERRCKEMISNLAKCNLSFICAHGRPSIVPLIDLNLFDDEEIIVATRNNKKYIPFRSQKRMIKKKNVDISP